MIGLTELAGRKKNKHGFLGEITEMSMRTIMVGAFAALCGICATVGVNQFRSTPTNDRSTVVVARMDIKPGVKLTTDMMTEIDWPKSTIPGGGFSSIEQVQGQFATQSFVQNEPIITNKISPNPTFLKIPEGMRAVTIQTKTESSMVAGLVAPGNRVDLVWTMTERNDHLEGPITLTLLENVEVLAVGQSTELPNREIDPNKNSKSITILVMPEMAEEINLAEEMGVLNFTLRSTTDAIEQEPRRKVSLKSLVAAGTADKQPKSQKSDVLSLKSLVQSQMQNLTQLINRTPEPKTDAQRLDVPDGMRAVSIQTPDDSTGVAGLIQPGNRVDVLLTTDLLRDHGSFLPDRVRSKLNVRTITLLENVTVVAVGNQSQSDESPEPKLAKSITLLVTPEMAQDINLGSEVGTLRLALRGADDDQDSGPRRTFPLEEKIAGIIGSSALLGHDKYESLARQRTTLIRVNRGGVNRDIPIYHSSVPVNRVESNSEDTVAGILPTQ